MATQDITTSRRALLAGLATAPVAAAPAMAGANADARLIELGRQWRAAFDHTETCADEDLVAACEARYALEEAIRDTSAAGLPGLAVKAAVAEVYDGNEQVGLHADLIAEAQRLAKQAA